MGWFQDLRDMLAKDESAGITKMDCPACPGTILRETRLGDFGSVILDICPRCSGVWLEKGELNRLDGSPWANVEEHRFHEVEGDHKSADCPNFAVALTPLSPADLPDVIVDRCPSCDGFWLDHGELDCYERSREESGRRKGWSRGQHKTGRLVRPAVANPSTPANPRLNRGNKGSHRNFVHPNVPRTITLSGNSGGDAKQYQEKAVKRAIEESQS